MVKLSNASQKFNILPAGLAFSALQIIPKYLGLLDEPMYDFSEENFKKVEQLCDIPFASYGGIEKYKTIEEKAAALFCLTTKNHLFPNGNKRTAVILTCIFLMINNKWIKMSQDEMYRLSLRIAESRAGNNEKTFRQVCEIFRSQIMDIHDVV